MATTGTIKVHLCTHPSLTLPRPIPQGPSSHHCYNTSRQLSGTACPSFLCAALSSPNFPPTHPHHLLLPAFTSSWKLLVPGSSDPGLLCQQLALALIPRGLLVLPSSSSSPDPPSAPHREHSSSHTGHLFLAASSSSESSQCGLELEEVLLWPQRVHFLH